MTNTALVQVVEIQNVGTHNIPIHVEPLANSPFFVPSGTIPIKPGTKITVEYSRIDIRQLQNLAKAKLINYTLYNRQVQQITPGSTGA